MYSNIYVLIDPTTNEIKYVGQTKRCLKRRFKSHITDMHVTHKTNWIKKLKRFGRLPIMKVIQSFENISDESLNQCEIYWIKHLKELGNNLTNSTIGGEGVRGCKSWVGKKHSEETKQKMSLSHMGKKISKEHKERLLNSRNEETYKKVAAAMIGKKKSVEHKLNIKLAWAKRKKDNDANI